MRGIQVFFLSLVCVVNIAWAWKDNPKVQENIEKGYAAWQAGNRTEAMTYYETALSYKADHVDALNSLGVIYEELGLYSKAEEKYLAAIKADYKFLPAYSNVAILYWNQGKMDKSAEYFEKRVQYGNPKDPWTIRAKQAVANIRAGEAMGRQAEVSQAVAEPQKVIMANSKLIPGTMPDATKAHIEMLEEEKAELTHAEAQKALDAMQKQQRPVAAKPKPQPAAAAPSMVVPKTTVKSSAELPKLKEVLPGTATPEQQRARVVNKALVETHETSSVKTAPAAPAKAWTPPPQPKPVKEEWTPPAPAKKTTTRSYQESSTPAYSDNVFGTIGKGFHWIWENI